MIDFKLIRGGVFSSDINASRSYLMGIAIILVVLYHTYCLIRGSIFGIFVPFTYGFIGVDIFLLINALGCCHSLQKNSLIKFYANRFKKAIPLFIIFAVIQTLSYRHFTHFDYSAFDWFCNLSTLSYWHIGGQCIEWYICASVVFWLLMPILKWVVKHFGAVAIVVSVVVFASIMKVSGTEWYHNCFLGRIPIFLLGIYLYFKEKANVYPFLVICAILVISKCNGYMIISMLCPLLLLILLWIKNFINVNVITWLGKYTLEIYLSNSIALYLFQQIYYNYSLDKPYCLIGYIALNTILTIIFVHITRLTKIIAKTNHSQISG